MPRLSDSITTLEECKKELDTLEQDYNKQAKAISLVKNLIAEFFTFSWSKRGRKQTIRFLWRLYNILTLSP